jgi:fatty-acyl-CoA synthase
MNGLMMDYDLNLLEVLTRSQNHFSNKEIIYVENESIKKYSYKEFYKRVSKLANLIKSFGINHGDRVATIAWNTHQHLELFLAVPCMGAVLHPINIRLPFEEIVYIINHAEDKLLFVDSSFAPLLEKILPFLETVENIVLLKEPRENLPKDIPLLNYEELLDHQPSSFNWPKIKEDQAAAMCYTSGTTGKPKGVVYSHRSTYLHTIALGLADTIAVSEKDTFLPVVPMFHVLAWGIPFAGLMLGSNLVLPGKDLSPEKILPLIQRENITKIAGVPTFWINMLEYLHNKPEVVDSFASLKLAISGGAAIPRFVVEELLNRYQIPVVQAWGMTETSPMGTISRVKSHQEALPLEKIIPSLLQQGNPVPGIHIRATNENNEEIQWDGETFGELEVRGAWVIKEYYHDDRSESAFHDGWLRTGDVVTIDPDGSIHIVDRIKDLILSGGEWISSQEIENKLVSFPKVLEAVVVGVPHPKWQERPIAFIVPKEQWRNKTTKKELTEYFLMNFPKFYIPDEIFIVESLPKTGVGKYDKKHLKSKYKDLFTKSK